MTDTRLIRNYLYSGIMAHIKTQKRGLSLRHTDKKNTCPDCGQEAKISVVGTDRVIACRSCRWSSYLGVLK